MVYKKESLISFEKSNNFYAYQTFSFKKKEFSMLNYPFKAWCFTSCLDAVIACAK